MVIYSAHASMDEVNLPEPFALLTENGERSRKQSRKSYLQSRLSNHEAEATRMSEANYSSRRTYTNTRARTNAPACIYIGGSEVRKRDRGGGENVKEERERCTYERARLHLHGRINSKKK